jgi:uncharacterized protein (DUF1501 family)
MSRSDPTTSEVLAGLSVPAPHDISRRRFLQAGAGAATSAWALSHWTRKALAAPLAPSDGIVVMIMMGGGNDGLNTVIPVGDGAYYDQRTSVAIPAASALRIAPGVGLHPALTTIKARYDAGGVAIVRGVGNPGQDLSHFSSMATWMTASRQATVHTGWLGRYLDELPPATLNGVAIGDSVPLHMVGARSTASAIPAEAEGLFGTSTEPADLRLFKGIRGLGAASTGRGASADTLGRLGVACIDSATRLSPALSPAIKGNSLVQQLTLAARLINLNIGIRVFAVGDGDHDTHANQLETQATNLANLDAAVAAFYATLAPERARQVLLATFSEFGRRVESNGSGGTDHGTANVMFLLSPAVRSGIHGDQPSLTALDPDGDLKPNIDFRSVYATVLHRWLNADASAVLGTSAAELDLFASGPSGPAVAPAAPARSVPPTSVPPRPASRTTPTVAPPKVAPPKSTSTRRRRKRTPKR